MAVSPQGPTANRALVERLDLELEILSDPGNEVAAAFGLRWTLPADLRRLYRGWDIDLTDAGWTLPMPARFIVDGQGVVRYARTDPDYTRRPEPEETLEALARL